MAGTFPNLTGFKAIRFEMESPTVRSQAANLSTHKRKLVSGAPRFVMSVRFPALSRAQVDELMAFIAEQQMGFDEFDIVLPVYSTPRGVATGSPLVNNVGGYAAGATSVSVDGWTVSQTGILLKFDKIKFAGHSKVYPVLNDPDSDGGGNATLTIPPLLEAVTDNEALTVTNVPFQVSVDGDVQRYTASAKAGPNRHTVEVDLMETW